MKWKALGQPSIVEMCLTCFEEGNENLSDESKFKDEDGVLAVVGHIKKATLIIPV